VVHVIAGKFKVKPESRDDMIALARSLFDASRAEPGNITYNFYEDRGNDDCFLFFEEWQSQEATDFHFQTPYFKAFMDRFPTMITGQPEITIYRVDDFDAL
jgi:quinol monooxygenase YgiN